MRLVKRLFNTRVCGAFESEVDATVKDAALKARLDHSMFSGKSGEFRILFGVESGSGLENIAIVGLGKRSKITPDLIRSAVFSTYKCTTAITRIKSIDSKLSMNIKFEDFGDAMHQAEGAALAGYEFNGLKSTKNRKTTPSISPANEERLERWKNGITLAKGLEN